MRGTLRLRNQSEGIFFIIAAASRLRSCHYRKGSEKQLLKTVKPEGRNVPFPLGWLVLGSSHPWEWNANFLWFERQASRWHEQKADQSPCLPSPSLTVREAIVVEPSELAYAFFRCACAVCFRSFSLRRWRRFLASSCFLSCWVSFWSRGYS